MNYWSKKAVVREKKPHCVNCAYSTRVITETIVLAILSRHDFSELIKMSNLFKTSLTSIDANIPFGSSSRKAYFINTKT